MNRMISMILIGLMAQPIAGCSGCDDPPVAPTPAPGSSASAVTEAVGAADAASGDPTPTAHPLSAGWQRTPPPEPTPGARALYRRAVDRAHAGDPAEAGRIFGRLRAEFGDSRFALRLRGGGHPAATAAVLALLSTVAAATVVGALRSIDAATGAPPAP